MGRLATAPIAALVVAFGLITARAQQPAPPAGTDPFHRPLDQILDVNVRDGLVYYRALQSSRGSLDRYVVSLNVPAATYESWPRESKMAFWVNAYNAFVLQTIVSRYPIRGTASAYPPSSIRQISGAFDQAKHRAAGRSLTLDEIEKKILPEFNEPRLMLALGRGAVGSGRLRSEAYTAARLKAQLEALQSEFVNEQHMIRIDRAAGTVSVTPIVSWNEAVFVQAYGDAAATFAQRSPVERAIVAFVRPHLLPLEQEFVDQNQFKTVFHAFDWRLNDLTGGRVE
jgi:Protein of unknown function, DUF547